MHHRRHRLDRRRRLDVDVGDEIEVHAYGTQRVIAHGGDGSASRFGAARTEGHGGLRAERSAVLSTPTLLVGLPP